MRILAYYQIRIKTHIPVFRSTFTVHQSGDSLAHLFYFQFKTKKKKLFYLSNFTRRIIKKY